MQTITTRHTKACSNIMLPCGMEKLRHCTSLATDFGRKNKFDLVEETTTLLVASLTLNLYLIRINAHDMR